MSARPLALPSVAALPVALLLATGKTSAQTPEPIVRSDATERVAPHTRVIPDGDWPRSNGIAAAVRSAYAERG